VLQLTNTTPFCAGFDVFPDAHGVDHLFVALKATFRLGAPLTIADDQVPLHDRDIHLGEPGRSSVRYPGERHLIKPATDVLLVGQAHATRGKPVRRLTVEVAVAGLRKVVDVVGDRRVRGPLAGVTDPEPFVAMPLVYERAFGGTREVAGQPTAHDPRNPVGRGFRGARAGDADDLLLPNLEDPAAPFLAAGDRAVPACFAPIAPDWAPRLARAGTYDDAWRTRRAPYLPVDFDPRFFNTAPAELIAPGHLVGGERVEVVHASADGPLRFALPIVDYAVTARISGARTRLRPLLETVLLEPDERRLCMTWRAAVACDRQVLQVEHITAHLDQLRFA
jgi:hypothetical protein